MDNLFFSVMVLALLPISIIMTATGNGDIFDNVDDQWHWAFVLIENSPCWKTEQEKLSIRNIYWIRYQEIRTQWVGRYWSMDTLISEVEEHVKACQER